MDTLIGPAFRFAMYVMFGLSMEVLFATFPINWMLGFRITRRVPEKYLEGFVSAYMIPLHGFGILFLFEPGRAVIAGLPVPVRYLLYCTAITTMEICWGWILEKTVGFYSWDYYAQSKYRIFKRGYSLWTLVPAWGVAGLALELYSDLMLHISPGVVEFITGRV